MSTGTMSIKKKRGHEMKYFKLKYIDGNWEYKQATNALALIKENDLCTRKHANTRIIELQGEQEAIAQDYFQERGIRQ